VADVKPQRKYASRLREEQARNTRVRIIEAAERLFIDQGYAATTIEAVAGAAGVAVDTVYATLGSKRGILSALLGMRLGGDAEPISMLDRPGPQAMRQERDQRRQLSMFAADIALVLERIRPVDDILRSAAAVDGDVASMRAGIQEERFRNMVIIAEWVAANGPLREGTSVDEAGAILWSLTSPEVHRQLRQLRGWPMARYARWLEETTTWTLLPDAAQ
jgi:AcrR family transcriptional regulator